MKPSKYCRDRGVTLNETKNYVGVSLTSIILWSKENPLFFKKIVQGVVNIKAGKMLVKSLDGKEIDKVLSKVGFATKKEFADFCNLRLYKVVTYFNEYPFLFLALINSDRDNDLNEVDVVYYFNNAKVTPAIAELVAGILNEKEDADVFRWELKNIINDFIKKIK